MGGYAVTTEQTITAEQTEAIRAYLKGRHIPAGLGTKESACSIAAINIALTGKLSDDIPACMSPVVGGWIIGAQDAMPDAMRNSDAWRDLLPLAAGTGREHEAERLRIILDWMWGAVLPHVQPVADRMGFGAPWAAMCRERTAAEARAAAGAARAARAAGARAAAAAASRAARAAEAAAWAAEARAAAARAARAAAGAEARAAASRAARAAAARAAAARAARAAEAAAAAPAAWAIFDPAAVLAKLIEAR
jgi:hypothetical protein